MHFQKGDYDLDAEYAANLQATLRKQGRQLGLVDALIAAVALRYNLILLTTDKDFQPVVGLYQRAPRSNTFYTSNGLLLVLLVSITQHNWLAI